MLSYRKRIAFGLLMLLLPVLAVAVVEGLSSLMLFARSARRASLAEDSYVERDTLLGWISKPNFARDNLYGPGLAFHTNAQRFRHTGVVAPNPRPGVTRVVCSGDSFTLGYGVSDADPWCAQLARDSSFETINMGQGGYGFDQAYLWYLRDGLPLHPAVHVVAFITEDFRRMQASKFHGAPRPAMSVAGGTLHTVGVPVPTPGLGPFMDRMAGVVRELRMYQLVQVFTGGPSRQNIPASRDSLTFEVVRAMAQDLTTRDRAAGAKTVFVYLPMEDDYRRGLADNYRRWWKAAADKGEIQYLDLIPALRAVPADSVPKLFIGADALRFKGAGGHYTAAGNKWVTERLREAIPELR